MVQCPLLGVDPLAGAGPYQLLQEHLQWEIRADLVLAYLLKTLDLGKLVMHVQKLAQQKFNIYVTHV